MTEDSVVALHHPGVTADPLTEVLRASYARFWVTA